MELAASGIEGSLLIFPAVIEEGPAVLDHLVKNHLHWLISQISMPLRHEEYSLPVPKPLLLVTKLSLRELVERIPKDRKALQDLTIGGQKPYAAFVPTYLDWNTVNDLQALQRLPGFSWAVLPVRDVQNTESHPG